MQMNTVLVAGATGYLGRQIAKHYMALGWHVRALVRSSSKAQSLELHATEFFQGEATKPETLDGAMKNIDLVVSALGITRQRDGLDYWDVDYQANANLLAEAQEAGVKRFAYVHVLNAKAMANVPMVDAKQAFVERLQAAPIASTVISPTGFFSDMADFYAMSKAGKVWLFGDGSKRMNPIDGADLAVAVADAVSLEQELVEIGGPDILTHREIAELAFAVQGKPVRIAYLPDIFRRLAIHVLPFATPKYIHGPALMFLKAMGMDMLGEQHGEKRLRQHFVELAQQASSTSRSKTGFKEEILNAR